MVSRGHQQRVIRIAYRSNSLSFSFFYSSLIRGLEIRDSVVVFVALDRTKIRHYNKEPQLKIDI